MQPRTRMQNTNYRSTCMHVLFHALFQRAWQAWHVVDNHGHFEAKGGGQTSGMPRLTGPSMTIEKSTAHQPMQPLELHHLHPVLLQNQKHIKDFSHRKKQYLGGGNLISTMFWTRIKVPLIKNIISKTRNTPPRKFCVLLLPGHLSASWHHPQTSCGNTAVCIRIRVKEMICFIVSHPEVSAFRSTIPASISFPVTTVEANIFEWNWRYFTMLHGGSNCK